MTLPWNSCRFDQSAAQTVSGAAAYQGPGDVVSGALGWWGLRAYNAAYATGSNPAIDVVDTATGLITTTVNITSAGDLDTATILGLGYAVSVKKLYDQTGHSVHMTQATLANMPTLNLSGFGSKPGMVFNGTTQTIGAAAGFTATQPFSMSIVHNQTSASSNDIFAHKIIDIELGGGGTNLVSIYAGSSFTAAATNGTAHAVQVVVNNASSSLNIDGSQTTGTAGTNVPTSDAGWLGSFDGASFFWPGKIAEFGEWSAGFTGGQITALNSQQHSYWGF